MQVHLHFRETVRKLAKSLDLSAIPETSSITLRRSH